MHIYPWHIDPLQLSIDALNTATPDMADLMADPYIYIEQCTYTYGRLTPQLSIDLCKTITPNQLNISHNAHIPMAD